MTHHPNFARTRGGELDWGAGGEPEPDAAVVLPDGDGIGCRVTLWASLLYNCCKLQLLQAHNVTENRNRVVQQDMDGRHSPESKDGAVRSQARKGLGVPSRDGCGSMMGKSQTSKPRPKKVETGGRCGCRTDSGRRSGTRPRLLWPAAWAPELKQSPLQCLAPAWVPQAAVVPCAPRKQGANRY